MQPLAYQKYASLLNIIPFMLYICLYISIYTFLSYLCKDFSVVDKWHQMGGSCWFNDVERDGHSLNEHNIPTFAWCYRGKIRNPSTKITDCQAENRIRQPENTRTALELEPACSVTFISSRQIEREESWEVVQLLQCTALNFIIMRFILFLLCQV